MLYFIGGVIVGISLTLWVQGIVRFEKDRHNLLELLSADEEKRGE